MTIAKGDGTVALPPHGSSASYLRTVAHSGLFSSVSQIANAVLGFGFVALLAKALSRSQAGSVFEAMSIFTGASLLATAGTDTGLLRVLSRYRDVDRRAVRLALAAALVPLAAVGIALGAAIIWANHGLAKVLVNEPALRHGTAEELLILGPFVPVAALYAALSSACQVWRIRFPIAIQYVLVPALRLAVLATVWPLLRRTSSALIVTVWVIPVGVGLAAVTWRLWRHIDASLSDRSVRISERPRDIARELWAFAGPRALEGVVLVFLAGLDVVLVGSFSSTAAAASYAIATRYAVLGVFGLVGLQLVLNPRFGELNHGADPSVGARLYDTSTTWCTLITWPPMLICITCSGTLMAFLGSGYRSGAVALIILAGGRLVAGATGPSASMLLMSGHSRLNLALTLVTVAIDVPLTIVLAPTLGATGGAIAWSTSAIVCNISQAVCLWRLYGVRPLTRTFLNALLLSTALFGIPGALVGEYLPGIAQVIGLVILAGLTYALILYRYPVAFSLEAVLPVSSRQRRPNGQHFASRSREVPFVSQGPKD